MPDTTIFDTHAFVKRGIDAGLTQREAEFIANEQVRLFEHNLATKTDIANLQKDIAGIHKDITGLQKETADIRKDITGLQKETADIRKDIAGLQKETADIRKDIAGLQKETADIRKDILAVKQDLSDKAILIIRWNVGTILAVAGLILGATKLL